MDVGAGLCAFISLEGSRIAVPSKGRLKDPSLRLLSQAGFEPLYGKADGRLLIVPTSSPGVRLVFVRPEDVPSIVASGASDLGITGLDYVRESRVDVEVCTTLGFGRARIVVAAPRESGFTGVEDLDGARVATKYVNIASRFFEERGVSVDIIRISGSAEVMPRLSAADAIVDAVSTGTTLMLHGLEPIETVMESEAVLIANNCSGDPRVEVIIESLKSVVSARGFKIVMMNVPGDRLSEVLEVLPGMAAPAVTRLESDRPMWEVITAVPTESLVEVVYGAKKRGAKDIVVLQVERVVL